MTDSIIEAVSRFLTPDVIGKIASATSLDSATAQKAANASVPAILGGLADLASKPGGARQLASAIAEQPAGLLSTLTNAIGGNAQLPDKGSSMLASLLGGGALGTLVSSVSKFAGIGEGSARSLMGLLTPVVLSVLGREQRAAGMEASGLARMLMDQKDQITAALPAGLSGMLGSLGAKPPESNVYASRQPAYMSSASSTDRAPAVTEPKASTSGASWAYWALPLLALLGLMWYLLPVAQPPDPTAQTRTSTSASAPVRIMPGPSDPSFYITKLADGWTSVGAFQRQDIYNRAGERIGSVKDLLVGPDGKVSAAVIGVGQFLGMGEKDIAVPLQALQRRANGGPLIMDVGKDLLRTAPAFEAGSQR
jgi:hypothetical protein